MKAYKVELLIIDHDNVGEQGIIDALEYARYPNRCIAPHVKRLTGVEIGKWDDAHPLNQRDETSEAEYARLFAQIHLVMENFNGTSFVVRALATAELAEAAKTQHEINLMPARRRFVKFTIENIELEAK